jgi:recombination protein RecA
MAKKSKAPDPVAVITEKYGKGAVFLLGSRKNVGDILTIPSGSYGIDRISGVGGYPRGRVVEIFGPESSGKTTLALHAIANAQAMGLRAAFIDAEHALDTRYAEALGVNRKKLLFSQPDYGEQALGIVETLAQTGGVGLVVVDSVAALVPKAEIDGEMGASHMGLHARLMSQAMRKLCGAAKKSGTCIIFLNQTRAKIGVTFGSKTTTTGGNALKFYASLRLDLARIGALKLQNVSLGNRTRARSVKNKMSPPWRDCEFDLFYGEGVIRAGEVLDAAVAAKTVQKSGAWFSFEGSRLGQGRLKVIRVLQADPDLLDDIAATLEE